MKRMAILAASALMLASFGAQSSVKADRVDLPPNECALFEVMRP